MKTLENKNSWTSQPFNRRRVNNNSFPISYDSLTGLPTQGIYKGFVRRVSSGSEEKRRSIGYYIYLHIKHFKQLNVVYGHTVSNQILVVIAQRLLKLMQHGRQLYHMDRNDFLINMLVKKNQVTLADDLKEAILLVISEPIFINGFIINVENKYRGSSIPNEWR